MKKPLKIAAYAAWFFVAFVIGVYLTFPLDEIKGLVATQIEDFLGKGKQGAYGVDPKVEIGALSLSGFGVKATRVQLQIGSRDPDPGPSIELDKISFGMRPWSLLSKSKTFVVDADLYGGSVDAVVSADDKGNATYVNLDVDSVDLAKFPLTTAKLGVPIGGKVNITAKLDLGTTPEKDGEGNVKLDVKNLSVGPGNLKLAAAFGGFELPTVDLGNLTGEIPVKQGKGSLTNVKLDGKDIQAELIGELFVKGKLQMSRLDVDGWFQPMPAFLEREKKFKSLLELGESLGGGMGGGMSLGKAKDEEGHYWFSLKGPLQNPSPLLARDAGKRAKGKGSKPSTSSSPLPPSKEPKEQKEPPPEPPDSKG